MSNAEYGTSASSRDDAAVRYSSSLEIEANYHRTLTPLLTFHVLPCGGGQNVALGSR
jgi:hypothetical protein